MKGLPLGTGGEEITWPDQADLRGRRAPGTRDVKPQPSNLVVVFFFPSRPPYPRPSVVSDPGCPWPRPFVLAPPRPLCLFFFCALLVPPFR